MAENHPELEAFRRKWREEVSQKTSSSGPSASLPPSTGSKAGPSQRPAKPAPSQRVFAAPTRYPVPERKDEDEEGGLPSVEGRTYHDVQNVDDTKRLGTEEDEFIRTSSKQEPRSALEHYERAVEKETQGNLGDSLNLYRKAYRVNTNFLNLSISRYQSIC